MGYSRCGEILVLGGSCPACYPTIPPFRAFDLLNNFLQDEIIYNMSILIVNQLYLGTQQWEGQERALTMIGPTRSTGLQ